MGGVIKITLFKALGCEHRYGDAIEMAVVADCGEALAYFIGEAPVQREDFWFQGQLADILGGAQNNIVHFQKGLVIGFQKAGSRNSDATL